jgi:putative membrane protein
MKHSVLAMAAVMVVALAGTVRAETPESVKLSPVDYTFIGLTNLGNQFQIDSGRLGETHAGSAAVRDYAKLMDTSHVQVEDNLMALLHKMNVRPPPTSLLAGAYKSLIGIMACERGTAFDRDYVSSQLDYQNANDALYRWEIQSGSNAELKAYARETLPKIDDHMHRVKALAMASSSSQAGSGHSG